jgi:aminoacyl tRNA synthase complex-interacting multifunctional protein 1
VRAVAGESFPLVTLDLAGAPKLERKPDPPKERKKKDAAALPADAAPAGSSDATPAPAEKTAEKKAKTENTAPVEEKEKKAKKEKKEKVNKEAKESGKKSGAATPAADEGAGEPVPSMIDLRVGHIVHSECLASVPLYKNSHSILIPVEKHPDADGLYVEVRRINR